MKKLFAFDIDGTLSNHGTPIPQGVASKLKELENRGIQIALVSGKPAYYLAGLARGMGLERALLIGENGCVIFDFATLEETRIVERLGAVDEVENQVISNFKNKVWLQPNRVALTVFPKKREEVPIIADFMRESLAPISNDVIIYEHVDAVDVIPVGVDKGVALKKVLNEKLFKKEDIIAFGDSTNDLPMFKEAGKVVVIGKTIAFENAIIFDTIMDALHSEIVEDFINKR
jgi:HAD superfamily hydrolase (TIGR01484 family)